LYKVRFHLGRGQNYKKWQVASLDGAAVYFDPETTKLKLINCKLKNNKNVSRKIFEGQNKMVCAWVECEEIQINPNSNTIKNKISYNPKKAPYWCDESGADIDNQKFDMIFSEGNALYMG